MRAATFWFTVLSSATSTRTGKPPKRTASAARISSSGPIRPCLTRAAEGWCFLDQAVESVFSNCDCRTGLTSEASIVPLSFCRTSIHWLTEVSSTTTVSRISGSALMVARQRGAVHARHLVIENREMVGIAAACRLPQGLERLLAGRKAAVAHSPTGDLFVQHAAIHFVIVHDEQRRLRRSSDWDGRLHAGWYRAAKAG